MAYGESLWSEDSLEYIYIYIVFLNPQFDIIAGFGILYDAAVCDTCDMLGE